MGNFDAYDIAMGEALSKSNACEIWTTCVHYKNYSSMQRKRNKENIVKILQNVSYREIWMDQAQDQNHTTPRHLI